MANQTQSRMRRLGVVVGLILLSSLIAPVASSRREGSSLPRRPWTLPTALDELALNPSDTYLQYVALQLARRGERVSEVSAQLTSLRGFQGPNRVADVDLFSLVSGALAIQESLQLDTMVGQTPARRTIPAAGSTDRPRRSGPVPVSTLSGPTVQSHPWERLLAGRKPEVSGLARLVPEDFYLVEFRSL